MQNINQGFNQDDLDRLQSSLDPWARIHSKEKEQSEQKLEAITDETPTTTSRPSIRLFQSFSRAPPPPKRTTTTFKPRSLADLFKHREGQKIGKGEETTEEPQEVPRSQAATNKGMIIFQ